MARMKILNSHEEAGFESPPQFNSVERKRFFSVSLAINAVLETLRTPTNKVFFLILTGYFRAKRRFFARQFSQADIEFAAHQLSVNPQDVHVENYSKVTYLRHQDLILQHFGYQAFDDLACAFIRSEIQTLVRVQHRPKLIFLETVETLTRKKIVIPTYNILANLIVEAINQHHHLMGEIIEKSLSKNQCAKLDSLLEKEANSDGGLGWRYQLTSFKIASSTISTAFKPSALSVFNRFYCLPDLQTQRYFD